MKEVISVRSALWFFLPVCMLLGVAASLLGLALFFLLLHGRQKTEVEFRQVGLWLLGIWWLYPLLNWLHSFMTPVEAGYPFLEFFSSHAPSGVLLGGLGFLFLFYRGKNEGNREAFLSGLAIGLSLLLLYGFLQGFWGFDYRFEGYVLSDSERFSEERFRARGLYGHPLSLASVGLALMGYFLGLFHWEDRDGRYIGIAFISLLLVFLSGSRASSLIGFGTIALFFLVRIPLLWTFGLGSLFALILFALGIFDRLMELASWEKMLDLPRVTFWKVHLQMFWDSPWLGHSYLHMKTFLREEYYQLLGYGDFFRKYTAHNIFLQILVEVGITGFCMIAWGMKEIGRIAGGKALVFSFALNLVHGLTQNTLYDASLVNVYLYLLLFHAFLKKEHPI